jgi:hypothetical protein
MEDRECNRIRPDIWVLKETSIQREKGFPPLVCEVRRGFSEVEFIFESNGDFIY